MTYQDVISALSEAHIPSPRLEARLLIAAVCRTNPNDVNADTPITPIQAKQLSELLQQRIAHKPLDKIVGHREFYKYDFKVTEDVLSPRPDTEVMLEAALDIIKRQGLKSVADFGTGSGCILLSLLKEIPALQGFGIDKSEAALRVAEQNAELLNVQNRCQFVQADWFVDDFSSILPQKVDLIISNPPYIPSADIALLDDEVKRFDPLDALDGGEDGLQSYKRIASISGGLILANGYIILEIGINQAQNVQNIFETRGFNCLKIIKDLAGIERCLIFVKK